MIATVLKLIARRLLAAMPILLIVSALLFCVLRLLPVDPAAMSLPPNATIAEIEAKRREMGLDKPLPQQYLIWLAGALHGDFGRSIALRREAGALVAATLPATIQLAACAMVIAAILGVGGGLLLFRVRGTPFEPVADLASILLLSIPEFLWGLILLFVFGVLLQLAAVHRPGVAGAAAAAHHRLSVARFLAGRTPRRVLERLPASDPARRRARAGVLADHHAGAALEPVRRLSRGLHPAGAAARPLRAAHPARPRAQERRRCRP